MVSQQFNNDLIYHEMFHAVQWGIAYASRLDPRDGVSLTVGSNVVDFITEGTAAAAGGSGVLGTGASTISVSTIPLAPGSRAEYPIHHIPYTLAVSDALDVGGDGYRMQDFWAFTGRKLNRGMAMLKPLFQVNRQTRYKNSGAENAGKVDAFLVAQGYAGGLKQAYWDYLKNQAMELNFDLRGLGKACDVTRNTSTARNPIVGNPVTPLTVNYASLETQKFVVPVTNVRHLSATLWNVTFTNLPSSGGDVRVTLRGGNDTRFVIYKVKQVNPGACQNTPDVQNGSAQFRGVSSDDRFVILGGNTAFGESASLQLEVERVTADVDDGTFDGNQFAVIGNVSTVDANANGVADSLLASDALRFLEADFIGEDADASGRVGDGRVDMSDFRRLRDVLLRSEGLGSFGGSPTHPKKSVAAGSSVVQLLDFNGSGSLGFNARVAVPGLEGNGFAVSGFNLVASGAGVAAQSVAVTRDAQGVPLLSDFEVFFNALLRAPSQWADSSYALSQLPQLLGSGDLEVVARELFDYPEVVMVESDVIGAPFAVGRVHTRSLSRQVYSLPAGSYTLRLVALDAQRNVVVGLKKPFSVVAGQDVLFAPATSVSVNSPAVYDSSVDDCARLGGVYGFDAKGLFEGFAPDIDTLDSFMYVDGNTFDVLERRKLTNFPLQLEAGTLRHCNIPTGTHFVGWDLNAGFFGSAAVTGFYVRSGRIASVQDNRWRGATWNSTDLDDPQSSSASVPLRFTLTSSFPGEAQQIVGLVLPGSAAVTRMKPELEAVYTVEAVDDDSNPGTFFSKIVGNVFIPFGTDARISYRGRSEWFHQIFCDVPSACLDGNAATVQAQSDSGGTTRRLTAPVRPVRSTKTRPRF
jgi:hypothetical protein